MSLDPDMKHQENAEELVFDEPIFEEQSQTLLEDNTDYNNALPAEEHATETQWYRRRSVQIGAGVAAVVATAAAIGIARNGDNEPDRKTITVAQPSATSAPSIGITPSATETTPDTAVTPTTIPSTTPKIVTSPSTSSSPDSQPTTSETTSTAERGVYESGISLELIQSGIDQTQKDSYIEEYPQIENYLSDATFARAASHLTTKSLAAYQKRFNTVYSSKALFELSGTPSLISRKDFKAILADDYIQKGTAFDGAPQIYLSAADDAYPAHTADFVKLAYMDPVLIENAEDDAKAAAESGRDHDYPGTTHSVILDARTVSVSDTDGNMNDVTVVGVLSDYSKTSSRLYAPSNLIFSWMALVPVKPIQNVDSYLEGYNNNSPVILYNGIPGG